MQPGAHNNEEGRKREGARSNKLKIQIFLTVVVLLYLDTMRTCICPLIRQESKSHPLGSPISCDRQHGSDPRESYSYWRSKIHVFQVIDTNRAAFGGGGGGGGGGGEGGLGTLLPPLELNSNILLYNIQGRWKQTKVGQAMLIYLLTPPLNVGWAMGWSLGVGSIACASRVST